MNKPEPFKARFESKCLLCHKTIVVDDWATWYEGKVVHLRCAEEAGDDEELSHG